MTFASVLGLSFLLLFGAAIIAGALGSKWLIAWEDRVMISLADAVRDYRLTLEEERRLLKGNPTQAGLVAVPSEVHRRGHAA